MSFKILRICSILLVECQNFCFLSELLKSYNEGKRMSKIFFVFIENINRYKQIEKRRF